MKIKLIQAGGFAGIKKTAEKDLDGLPASVQQKLQDLFKHPVQDAAVKSPMRDKEQLFLELNGRTLQVDHLMGDMELSRFVQQMKDELHY
jgi:hypothetical protein